MTLNHGFRISDSITSDRPDLDEDDNCVLQEEIRNRVCWICYCGNESDIEAEDGWCHPCKCCGSTKWVHQSCLQKWIDSKQDVAESNSRIPCKVCGYEYMIVLPKAGLFYQACSHISQLLGIFHKCIMGTVCFGSVYSTFAGFGAFSLLQLYGTQEGLEMLLQQDTATLIFGLPSIPIALFVTKMFNWYPLGKTLYRRVLLQLYPLSLLKPKNLPAWREKEYYSNLSWYIPPSGLLQALRCTLSFPTMANITGHLLFYSIKSNYQRTLIGGIAYMGLRGLLEISYAELKFLRACERRVQNYHHQLDIISTIVT